MTASDTHTDPDTPGRRPPFECEECGDVVTPREIAHHADRRHAGDASFRRRRRL